MNDWTHPIFDLDEVGSYCQSAVCPCGTMNKIARLMYGDPSQKNSVHTFTTTFLSFLIDIPCCFTATTASNVAASYWKKRINGEPEEDYEDDFDDRWSPDDSSLSNDCLPLSWCKFYTLGACESCCSALCIGPRVSSKNFPTLFLCAAACVYPLCICPSAFLLRRLAISKLEIDSESIPNSCAKSLLCTPCSLVQVHEELQTSTSFTSHPQAINNMH